MKKGIVLQVCAITFGALFLVSCGNKDKNSRWDVDVSHVSVNVKLERFEKDFDAVNSKKDVHTQLQNLHRKYGTFYEDFIEQIINAGSTKDTLYYANIRKILNTKPYQDLRDTVFRIYTEDKIRLIETDLVSACKHLKYYYPKIKFPKFITYISGFEVQLPIGDEYLGIGMDMFLGSTCAYYEALAGQIPKYISRRFTPENVVPRVMEAMIRENLYTEHNDDKQLLERMIYNGKVLVLMDALLPNCPDSLKIGYTAKQAQWAKDNEGQVWNFFVGEKLLYGTDFMQVDKYINEAPFTPTLGERNESAPKLGVYIGWQIVRKYMEKHPKMSLQKMLLERDAQKILNGSGYKPK